MFQFPITSQPGLKSEVLSGFRDGMNIVDDDSMLDADSARLLINLHQSTDGRLRVRWGTELAADLSEEFDDIIGIEEFAGHLIVVNSDGRIAVSTEDGVWAIIWDDTIAATRTGAPLGWGPCAFISFAHFKNTLIVCNGIDKPLDIDQNLIVNYVKDPATGSNANVPRAAYVIASQQFCLYAGDPFDPSILYITGKGTSNTFQGDAGSDGVNIDMSVYARLGAADIRGLSPFRDRVLVGFDQQFVIASIGTYNTDNEHVPTFSDAIELYGLLNQSCIVSSGDDVVFASITGINTVTRATLTGLIQPAKLSRNIEPEIVAHLTSLSDYQLATWPFMLYNGRNNQFMMFAPNLPYNEEVYETPGYVMAAERGTKVVSWQLFKGWNWSCGCTTRLQRVYFAREGYIFRMGSDAQPIYRDHEGWEEMWTDDTPFDDGRGFATTDPDADYRHGVSIRFDYISAWYTMGARRNSKMIKYAGLETDGEARFTLQHFIDGILFDRSNAGEDWTDETDFSDGFGWNLSEPDYDPVLEMEFVGGESHGYGDSRYGASYGDGRITDDERLFAWPTKGMRHKTRIFGDAIDGLGIGSVSYLYRVGSIRR